MVIAPLSLSAAAWVITPVVMSRLRAAVPTWVLSSGGILR